MGVFEDDVRPQNRQMQMRPAVIVSVRVTAWVSGVRVFCARMSDVLVSYAGRCGRRDRARREEQRRSEAVASAAAASGHGAV